MSLSDLLGRAHAELAARFENAPSAPNLLFFSFTDGTSRCRTIRAAGSNFTQAWRNGAAGCQSEAQRHNVDARWLRVDWVAETKATTWKELGARLARTKRNYFRMGVALDPELRFAFLEPELNANAMLYLGADKTEAGVNIKNFTVAAQRRFGKALTLDFSPETAVYVFAHEGLFVSDDPALAALPDAGQPNWLPGTPTRLGWRNPVSLNAGRRQIEQLTPEHVHALIDSSANFLARQVQKNGQFVYGHFPCFGRLIPTYNTLRHASSVYSMLEAWELNRNDTLLAAARRALDYLTEKIIRRYQQPDGSWLAYNVDVNDEIKLGANAVSLLALVKYDELTQDTRYRGLMEELALGIARMQDPGTGRLVHVLKAEDLSVKEDFRIVYYDGEAAFGLMRLYGLTRDPRWLAIVEKSFDYFIANDHWKHHDHWLSYCANELTLHKPEEKYFRFGVQNVAGYLDFILQRETTYPTLLELSMAFEAMLKRIHNEHPEMLHVLEGLDTDKFHQALHHRAHYLLNGFFWPELAMYFAKPQTIVGSFFIRHHTFRVRIDDIEHYLSGYVAYWKMLTGAQRKPPKRSASNRAIIAWGGDVNLGRRQHYRTATLGAANVLSIPALKEADLAIVNLECVVATQGEQGVRKGEGGPYYYRARPEMLKVLLDAGIDVVATANNHSGDYGPQALLEQGEWLNAAGIAHAGTGVNREAAFTAAQRLAGSLNIAVFSVDATQHRFAASARSPGNAYLSLDNPADWFAEFAPRIKAARAQAHLVFVAVHWGVNFSHEPSGAQRAAAHALIEAGADAVLGASAHIVQGIEIHKNRPIIYDAGDLLFDSIRREPRRSGVFRLECDHTGVRELCFAPVSVGFGQTTQLSGDEARSASEDFAQSCAALGTAISINTAGQACLTLRPPARNYSSPVPSPRVWPDPDIVMRARDFLASHATRYSVDVVPEDARMEPCALGPLTLLGFRVTPQTITQRRMLWVETFWQSSAPVQEDWRIDIRAIPLRKSTMRPWGEAMDHDPCDWMMPTSRWEPGVIYRDYYGLRPPYLKDWENVDLQVSVRLVSDGSASTSVKLPVTVRLSVPGKEAAGKQGLPPGAAPAYHTSFPDLINDCGPGQTWTAGQLAAVTRGKWIVEPPEGWYVKSVVAGAKHIAMVPGPTLFVGHDSWDRCRHEQSRPPARNFDRHSIIAANAGRLAGAVVSEAGIADSLPKSFPVLQVADPIGCLVELGLAARQRYRGDVIAVTGTAGKSTTTALIQTLLGGRERVLASFDNYNSRVGAPATLANLSPGYEAAVIEVAQSALWMKRGPVTRLLRPTVALITEIGMSQTDARVQSLEDAARWKARIFDGLCGAAVAIVGEHLPCLDYVLEQARRHARQVVIFGRSRNADIRILEVAMDEEGSWVRLALPSGLLRLRVPAPGSGMVNNTVAAVAVLVALGRDTGSVGQTLARFEPHEGRMQHHALQLGGAHVQVIDDSFNATVTSMVNALSVLGANRKQPPKRRVAILGRIVHLGEQAQALHAGLAEPVVASGADHVITHGDEMRYLRDVLPETLLGPHFSDAPTLVEYLQKELRDGDLVLLKGSRRDSDFGSIFSLLAQCSASHDMDSTERVTTGTNDA